MILRNATNTALAFAALLYAGPSMADSARDAAQRILREPAYSFCHDAGRRVRPSELWYCGYVDEHSACPEFARACAALVPRQPSSCAGPSTIGSVPFAQIGVLAFLAAGAAVLLFFVGRLLARARRQEALVDRGGESDFARPSMIPLATAPSSELLARALDAHSRGDERTALFTIFAALLRRLDERGAVRIDPAHTSGDYVRQCSMPEYKPPLRDAAREVERIRFGGGRATGELFERLRARIEPIVRALTVVLIALIAGQSLSCADEPGGTGGGDAGPGGHRAVRELLSTQGIRARPLLDAVDEMRDTSRVMVVDGATISLEPAQWSAVMAWVESGGRLVLAGGVHGWPESAEVHSAGGIAGATDVVLSEELGSLHATVHEGDPTLTSPASYERVANYAGEDGLYAVAVSRQRGRILFLASHDLMTNAGLAVGNNADATVAILRAFAGDRDVFFVENPSGAANNPLRSLQRAGLLPVVLQGLLALALFYVLVGRHFATPRDVSSRERRSFSEHVRAVGALYARSRASRAVLAAYSKLVLDRIRERVGAGRGTLAEAIAARVGEPREEVEGVVARIEAAVGAGGYAGNEAADLQLVKRLNDWFTRLS